MLPEPLNTIITATGVIWLLTVVAGFMIFARRNIFNDVRHPFCAAITAVSAIASLVATWVALVLVIGYSATSMYGHFGIWYLLALLVLAIVATLVLLLWTKNNERKPLTDPDQLLTSSPDD